MTRPLQTYEITWRTGHVERIYASQVTYPGMGLEILGRTRTFRVIEFHGEVNGVWSLVLRADEDDLRTVRLLVDGVEAVPEHAGGRR
ncbi:MAG: hypothetical protein V4515_15085 [Chloroflexota bacterium]